MTGHRLGGWWRCRACLRHPWHAVRSWWIVSSFPRPEVGLWFGIVGLVLAGMILGVAANDTYRGYQQEGIWAEFLAGGIAVLSAGHMVVMAAFGLIEDATEPDQPAPDDPYDQDANS